MRAVFAVLGFVGFYVVTLAAIVGLGATGLGLLLLATKLHVSKATLLVGLVALASLLAAGVLAWSAFPRVDRFVPPGPDLLADEHPALFTMIREVSEATGQSMPVHVYAVLDVNAFVTERGGFMGFGSRRVMGIGLGLLNAFTVDEVRAVIAHEFGHFHGGDTRLGPWVYKTRATMGRTVNSLQLAAAKVAEIEAMRIVLAVVEAPFRWMALGYLRLSASVSRAQEFEADAVAARAVGAAPVLSGFSKLAGTSAAMNGYFEELSALIGHGALPPVLSGARQFVEANRERLAQVDAESAKFGEADPFDSHPPLSERISAVRKLTLPDIASRRADERLCIELVNAPEALARSFITEQVGTPLKSIDWSEAAPLFMRDQHRALRHHRRWLEGRGAGDVNREHRTQCDAVRIVDGIGSHLPDLELTVVTHLAGQLYSAAFSIALEHLGYVASTGPGEPMRFQRGETIIEPAAIVRRYLTGEMPDEEWVAFWSNAGLAEKPWAAVVWKD